VGEFSFILGSLARALGLINDAGWNALVAVSIISISLNPSIYRWARRISTTATKLTTAVNNRPSMIDPKRCILVGYGPVGQIVHKLLVDRNAVVAIVDLNLDTVRRLRAQGHTAIYGDVLRPGTLEEAGVAAAGSLILSADVEDAAEIIRQARLLNPQLRVLARCAHLRDAAALRNAGASIVAAGEAEVGVALAEAVTADDNIAPGAAIGQRTVIRSRLYGAG
jgi:K+:H+ antiporter